MRRLFSVAARNLLRNKRRTLLSALAIVVGLASTLFLRGVINGFIVTILDDTVYGRVGAIQLHRTDWRKADGDLKKWEFAADPVLVDKLRAVPGVRAVTPRLEFEGMIGNGTISTVFMATAIDPRTEYDVCPTRKMSVYAGGAPLDESAEDGTVIGGLIGGFLDAKVGSSLTVTSATLRGTQNALDFTVRGVATSRLMIDSKRVITIPLGTAQRLLDMEGRITGLAVAVDDLQQVDAVAARLRDAAGPGFEVETWKQLQPALRDRISYSGYVLGFVVLILGLLVATTVVNTMMMSVYERVREIGTMMAVGVRRREVLLLFLSEASVLGSLGGVIGLALGSTIVFALGARGLHVKPPGGDEMLITPYLTPGFVAAAFALAVLGTLLSGVAPAMRASRLSPIEALRAN